ncbi:TetR/AcrR family transcriptional regulator [uncultured Jatrophihabitans sp.]|uniref:TetR/AcrR family transcriptional regulator n=1 Tax=uncultured Jatrophihabitans sp. TaxID=1610747 RepID=UPI0035CCA198
MTAVGTARRGRPRDETIDAAILDATVQEMIEVGFFAISMERVAARAGVAKTTVYRRWPDAVELGVEALRRLKGTVGDVPETDARGQIIWLAERMRRVWGNPTFAAAMRRVIAEGTAHPALFRDAQDRLVGPHLVSLNAAIDRAKDDGLIRTDADTTWVRRLIVGPTLSAALTLRKVPTADELVRTIDVVLRGLAP